LPVSVKTPSEKDFSRLSTYDGFRPKDLLEQDKLIVKVQNYMGKIIITFSGYEDTPWVVQRYDMERRHRPRA